MTFPENFGLSGNAKNTFPVRIDDLYPVYSPYVSEVDTLYSIN